jgi:NADH:ubiquinone oxidoreductase subunit E
MKAPTRSPTHKDIEVSRLSTMALEIEDIAADGMVGLRDLIELAVERGRPVSHYLAAAALHEIRVATTGNLTIRVCAGTCQRWGALDLLDHMATRWENAEAFTIAPVTCLDRCDQAPACELHGEHGLLVLAPATGANLDEALDQLI